MWAIDFCIYVNVPEIKQTPIPLKISSAAHSHTVTNFYESTMNVENLSFFAYYLTAPSQFFLLLFSLSPTISLLASLSNHLSLLFSLSLSYHLFVPSLLPFSLWFCSGFVNSDIEMNSYYFLQLWGMCRCCIYSTVGFLPWMWTGPS